MPCSTSVPASYPLVVFVLCLRILDFNVFFDELESQWTNIDYVAVAQHLPSDAFLIYPGAVAAAQILEHTPCLGLGDSRMSITDKCIVRLEVIFGAGSD